MQSKPSRFLTEKVAKPIYRVSRFLGGMAVRTLELAQRRIAVSIAALKRALEELPPEPEPPSPGPWHARHIISTFHKRAKPKL
jgi:hypothetical protein